MLDSMRFSVARLITWAQLSFCATGSHLNNDAGSNCREFFSSSQFDEIAKKMGVSNMKYALSILSNNPKRSEYEPGVVIFNKKWFQELTPDVRSAVLVHELEHSKTHKTHFYSVVALLAAAAFGIITLIFNHIFTSGVIVTFFLMSLAVVYFQVSWFYEFKSDEAAARVVGVKAALDMLEKIGNEQRGVFTMFQTHPPIQKRRRRITRIS
jgi:Zn-dependent protease with chaperone function